MLCVLRSVDKANGYVFGALENNNMAIFKVAASEYLDVLRGLLYLLIFLLIFLLLLQLL
jgi:hypothetical protein